MVRDHAAATGVLPGQHHLAPANVEISNTSLSVSPQPGGPGMWDIFLPAGARAVRFILRGPEITQPGGGARVGVIGIATTAMLEASTVSFGPRLGSGCRVAIYSQAAGAANLSHKMFGSAVGTLALTDARIVDVSGFLYLRLTWTNYGTSYVTLQCWGEVAVLG